MAARKIKIGIAATALLPALLSAQSSAPSLALKDAETLALKNHPQVLATQGTYLRADQLTREARSAYFPMLNGAITGAQANLGSRLGAGVINDPELFNHFGAGLSLSQLITDSGRTQNLVASSRLQAQASRADYQATRYDVVLGVDQAYYDALLAKQLVKTAEQTVKTRQSVVDQTTELVRNKLKSEVDQSFAEVNLSDAKLMLLRANERLDSAYANLAEALGSDHVVEYQLQDQPMPAQLPSTPDSLVTQAFQNRPELASMRLQQESDQKFVYAERDLKRPSVNLWAVGGALPYIEPGSANADIPAGYEAVALNVTIPIFNGSLFSARRQAAEYQLQVTQQRARDLQNRIARDVRTSWERAETSFDAIATTQQLLAHANLALQLAQGRYNLGLASIIELTQAQLGQTQAQVENVNAKYEYQEAYAALQYTLGLLR